jgi:hypothetical protein
LGVIVEGLLLLPQGRVDTANVVEGVGFAPTVTTIDETAKAV